MYHHKTEKAALRDWFNTFAEKECKNRSAFYYTLAQQIAEDEDLLKLASHSRKGQPMPNLFLAAVH